MKTLWQKIWTRRPKEIHIIHKGEITINLNGTPPHIHTQTPLKDKDQPNEPQLDIAKDIDLERIQIPAVDFGDEIKDEE